MTYKELLEKCKAQPGFLEKRAQKEPEAQFRYRLWLEDQAQHNHGKQQQEKK